MLVAGCIVQILEKNKYIVTNIEVLTELYNI